MSHLAEDHGRQASRPQAKRRDRISIGRLTKDSYSQHSVSISSPCPRLDVPSISCWGILPATSIHLLYTMPEIADTLRENVHQYVQLAHGLRSSVAHLDELGEEELG